MITVTLFTADEYTEKEFSGETALICAVLEMCEHIGKGGWCMVGYKNKYMMITNVLQALGVA